MLTPMEEMKAYVGFGQVDADRLARLWTAVAPRRAEITDRFYAPVLANPSARAVLKDDAQVERLKVTLDRWLEELVRGPHDEAYYERRLRIGSVHVDVGLPSRFMQMAMSVFRDVLGEIARGAFPASDAADMVRSVEKISSIDLAIMTGTYIKGRQNRAMSTLQDLLVSHLPATVVLIDQAGIVTASTRITTDLFAGDRIVGGRYLDAFPRELVEAADLQAQVARALASGREITLLRVDATIAGVSRSFRFDVIPLSHALAAALLHVEELTQAVEIEARLRRSEALANLGAMSAAVAHELRNPLAGISGAIQVIARSFPVEDRRRPVMEKVDDQIRRLNNLVTDLLSFARPDPARMQSVSLDEIARAAVDLLSKERPDVSCEIIGDGDAWADPNLVQHVLINLLQNAGQALDSQPDARIQVVLSPGSLVVNDNGPGIDAAIRGQIFEPFYTTRTRGTGLGLAISRKAAGAMGADLVLTTGDLPGAAFALRFRRAPER